MSAADEARAVGDYWDGHPKPPDEPVTPEAQAQYDQDLVAWENKFGPDGPPDPPEPPAIPGPPTPGAGMPAARMGDLTAHGGSIAVATGLTAGVMIGYLPAACLGDQHVCPMFSGPKPHVGGTIVKGSLSVMIGYKPAARVSDNTVCSPEPGAIALGELTVMIGDQGTPYGSSAPPAPPGALAPAAAPAATPGEVTSSAAASPPSLSPQAASAEAAFKSAAESGTPLIDRCDACAKV